MTRKLGDHIQFTERLERVYEGEKSYWRPVPMDCIWIGIFIGYRYIRDTHVTYCPPEQSTYKILKTHKVALIANDLYKNPIYVALDNLEKPYARF